MDYATEQASQSDAPASPSEAELRAILAQSDLDAAAGRMVPVTDVLAELDTIADKLERSRHARHA